MEKKEKEHIIKNLKNVKLVFGNGFDLFCGLKTRYSDYFEYNSNRYIKIRNWIDELLFNDRYEDYLNPRNANYNNFYPTIQLDDITTIWDIYFVLKSPKDKKDILWCQIEEEIKETFNLETRNDKTVNWDLIYRYFASGFITMFPNLTKNEFICSCYIKNKYNKLDSHDAFMDILLNELKLFEKEFGKYIKKEILKTEYKTNALLTVCKFINLKKGNLASIDTFNYSVINPETLIFNNINGDYENPIFGIDRINDTKVDQRYIFTKNYRRMSNNMNLNHIVEDIPFDNIVVFGHSLNEQDYNYFFPLFDKLKITSSEFRGKLVFAYNIYDSKKKDKIKSDLLLNVTKMFKRYEEYSKGSTENRLLEILNFNGNIIYYQINDKDLVLDKKNV